MIQPNEIRVGNLFNPISRNTEVHLPATGVIIKIIEIKAFSVSEILHNYRPELLYGYIERPIRDLSPIPLTNELLVQCGREIEELNGIRYVKLNHFLVLIIQPTHLILSFFDGRKFTDLQVRIQFLHEFQNLYFALTGEELETNEVTPPEFHRETPTL